MHVNEQVLLSQDVEYSNYNNFYGAFLPLCSHSYKLQYAMRMNCLIFAGKH